MGEKKKASSDFLIKYKDDFQKIFEDYRDNVDANIIQYESLCAKVPTAILNEIRSIMTHMARISIAENEKSEIRNIEKIRSHMKRARLDCYKYICMEISKKHKEFFDRYNGINYFQIDNGEFIVKLSNDYFEAQNALMDAKVKESDNAPSDELYKAFEKAYLEYADVYIELKKAIPKAEELLQKKHENDKKREEDSDATFKGLMGGIFGIIIGIIICIIF